MRSKIINERFIIVLVLIVISAGLLVQNSWANQQQIKTAPISFSIAKLYFELNNTDGDLGIHALVYGEPWDKLRITGFNNSRILKIKVAGRLQKQGLTEIFFESAEPSFKKLFPIQFFHRFPAGKYKISGETLRGQKLESKMELTHVMPAPPEPTVNGRAMSNNCVEKTVVVTTLPVTIEWPAVTMSHPDPNGGGAAVQPPVPIVINNYEIILEVTLGEEGNEFNSVVSAILPPGVTSFTVPEEFISLGDKFKYEVIVRGKNFNQTAIESCFVLKLE